MAVDYFAAEIEKTQQRFNETFGQQTICNLTTRTLAIMSIIRMGLLSKQIAKAENKDHVRKEIRRFMKARTLLWEIYNQFNPDTRERRSHDHYPIDQKEIPCVGSHAGG